MTYRVLQRYLTSEGQNPDFDDGPGFGEIVKVELESDPGDAEIKNYLYDAIIQAQDEYEREHEIETVLLGYVMYVDRTHRPGPMLKAEYWLTTREVYDEVLSLRRMGLDIEPYRAELVIPLATIAIYFIGAIIFGLVTAAIATYIRNKWVEKSIIYRWGSAEGIRPGTEEIVYHAHEDGEEGGFTKLIKNIIILGAVLFGGYFIYKYFIIGEGLKEVPRVRY